MAKHIRSWPTGRAMRRSKCIDVNDVGTRVISGVFANCIDVAYVRVCDGCECILCSFFGVNKCCMRATPADGRAMKLQSCKRAEKEMQGKDRRRRRRRRRRQNCSISFSRCFFSAFFGLILFHFRLFLLQDVMNFFGMKIACVCQGSSV